MLIDAPRPRKHRPDPDAFCSASGKYLIVSNGAALPLRCVKCNAPSSNAFPYMLRRVPLWAYPFAYLGLFFVLIAFSRLRHPPARIYVCVCDRHHRQRRWAIWISLCLFALGIATMVISPRLPIEDYVDPPAMLGMAGVIPLIASFIVALTRGRLLAVADTVDNAVYVKGAHPAFLNSLIAAPSDRNAESPGEK